MFIAVLVILASFLWMYQEKQSSEEKRLRSEAAQKSIEAERDSISRLNRIIVSNNESMARQLAINEAQKDSIEKLNKQNEDKMKLIEYQRSLLDKENKNLNIENEQLKSHIQAYENSEEIKAKTNIEDARIKTKNQIENNNTISNEKKSQQK